MNRPSFLYLLLLLSCSACAQQTTAPYQNKTLSVEERVADLLSKMSVEEKVMQMRIFHANKGIK
ncbi:MAG: hypothetical protein AAGA31_18225, partial [Bacteroidota bacterium]